jgi:hypothetical protein
MERERFDGADIAHILRCCVAEIDWPHLLRRFGPDWRVLLSHLVVFGYVYPGERARIPAAVNAIRLEQALVKLQAERRIVVLHYSPIRATLQGEDPEIYAFLGSSRLEEPINQFRATAVFHGHAHNGITDGKTSTGIPVYNVSAPALHKTGKPYRIVEL